MSLNSCPICHSNNLYVFLKRYNIPIVQNIICRDENSAFAIPKGDLFLNYCKTCGFVFNSEFLDKNLIYGENYDNRQIFSPYFYQYLQKLSDCLILKYNINKTNIIEIGCGDGSFLKLMVSKGNNRGIGFDPSYKGEEYYCNGNIQFITDYYSPKYSNYNADVIITRHVIEHIHNPLDLLRQIKNCFYEYSDKKKLIIETPDLNWIINNNAFWDFCYEHCSYFSPISILNLLDIAGFNNCELIPTFKGQYMISISQLSRIKNQENPHFTVNEKDIKLIEKYSKNENELIKNSQLLIKKFFECANVYLWGAGAKGVIFANLVDPERKYITGIVDINPAKQQKFIPGTGHKIISPKNIKDTGIVIIMNNIYSEEIKKILMNHGKSLRITTIETIINNLCQ